MSRRRGRPDSLHWNASDPLSDEAREELRRLHDERALPERWAMAARLAELLDGAAGLSMEGEMLATALRRLPTRAEVERVQDWRSWPEGRAESLAFRVLEGGCRPADVAHQFGTTTETVDAIVAAEQDRLRRNSA